MSPEADARREFMAMPTELLLIRHGETDFNRELRFQGHVDVPLNDNGRLQAQRLAARLSEEAFDLLLASDLRRARETAQPLSHAAGAPLRVDPAWREQGFGVLEGLTADEARTRAPALWTQWQRHDPDAAPQGGEPRRMFYERVWAALRGLAAAHPGARIVVVTHGGVLDMVWRGLHGESLAGPRACEIPNTGLNRLRWIGGRPQLVGWADAAHLEGMSLPPVTIPTGRPLPAASHPAGSD
jgi:probable phosphoglycerate mutase